MKRWLSLLPAILMLSIVSASAAYAADATAPKAPATQITPVVIVPEPAPPAPLPTPPAPVPQTPASTPVAVPATSAVATVATTAANVGQCHIGISYRLQATPDAPVTLDKNIPDAGLITQSACRTLCDEMTKPISTNPGNISGSSRCSFGAAVINDTQWQVAP